MQIYYVDTLSMPECNGKQAAVIYATLSLYFLHVNMNPVISKQIIFLVAQ